MAANEALNAYRCLSITKEKLLNEVDPPSRSFYTNHPIIIDYEDVIRALKMYLSTDITYQALLDWVNTIWFSELYAYKGAYEDCIASVMSAVEESDERDPPGLGENECLSFIEALESNREL